MNATERSEMDEHFNSDNESNLRRWEEKMRLLGCCQAAKTQFHLLSRLYLRPSASICGLTSEIFSEWYLSSNILFSSAFLRALRGGNSHLQPTHNNSRHCSYESSPETAIGHIDQGAKREPTHNLLHNNEVCVHEHARWA